MTDKEIATFFELLDKVVNIRGMSFKEKKEWVEMKAKDNDSETNLEEFVSWFDD